MVLRINLLICILLFDKENFDTFHDVHLSSDMAEDLVRKQDLFLKLFFRLKVQSRELRNNYLKEKIKTENASVQKQKNDEIIKAYNENLKNVILEINPEFSSKTVNLIKKNY